MGVRHPSAPQTVITSPSCFSCSLELTLFLRSLWFQSLDGASFKTWPGWGLWNWASENGAGAHCAQWPSWAVFTSPRGRVPEPYLQERVMSSCSTGQPGQGLQALACVAPKPTESSVCCAPGALPQAAWFGRVTFLAEAHVIHAGCHGSKSKWASQVGKVAVGVMAAGPPVSSAPVLLATFSACPWLLCCGWGCRPPWR